MKVTMMLADYAQSVNGKLYITGGGWSQIGPAPTPMAVAIKIEVPWTKANDKHNLKVELLDSDFRPVSIQTPVGNSPVAITGDFEVGRPPGLIKGSPLDTTFAFNIGPIPLEPEKRYVWKLTIDGDTHEDWQVSFSTRPGQKKPTPQ